MESIGKQGAAKQTLKAPLLQSFGESILARLRILVQQTGKSVEEIFSQFDTDGSGSLNRTEFRKALRAMNLGLSIIQINEIIELCDSKDLKGHTRYDAVKGDGTINYNEFKEKLYDVPENEVRMMQRANERLVNLKESMILHMGSTNDAFR